MSATLVNAEISECMVRVLQLLLPAYAHLTGVPVNKVQSLAETLPNFSCVLRENSPGFSCLIGDRAPMKLCINLSSVDAGFGFLANPMSGVALFRRRYFRAGEALLNTLELKQTCVLGPIAEESLGIFGPCGPQCLDKFIHGMFWLATSTGIPGVLIYVDNSVYPDENWLDMKYLRFTSYKSKRFEKIINSIDAFCPYYQISSVGIEGIDLDQTWANFISIVLKTCPLVYLGHCSYRLLTFGIL